jgi:hypothetical protein
MKHFLGRQIESEEIGFCCYQVAVFGWGFTRSFSEKFISQEREKICVGFWLFWVPQLNTSVT